MVPEPGYYSLIQYCPDASRLEAMNVGLVLFCPALDYLNVKLADNNDRIARVFKGQDFRPWAVNAAKRALAERLLSTDYRPRSLEEFQHFIDTRANDLVLTVPRSLRVNRPDEEVEALFRELVLEPPGRQKERGARLAPELQRVFDQLVVAGRARRDYRLQVPVLGKTLKVPYAYRNGALNLVKPQRFSASEGTATSTAMKLAVEGDLIARHGADQEGQKRLIVVAGFPGERPNEQLRNRVLDILAEYSVKAVPPEEVPEFAEQVQREAHE